MRTFRPFPLILVLLCPALTLGDDKPGDNRKSDEPLTGMWRGMYHYPNDAPDPVRFVVIVVQKGTTTVGFIREPNSFGNQTEPWLHASIKGSFDEKAGKLTFKKTYDGTAGPDHDVEYSGEISKDGKKVEGFWDIDGTGGRFTLEKDVNTGSGPLAGAFSGTYHYPQGSKVEPVKLHMVAIHHGKKVMGFLTEPNRKNNDDPWLHAVVRGSFDEKTGKLSFTKTYDGTVGEDHEVESTGDLVRQEVPPIDAQEVARTIAQLGSDKFDEREKATKALAAMGPGAYDAVKQAARTSTDAEVQRRAKDLLPRLEKDTKFEGTWTLPDDGGTGRFTLQKLRSDVKLLENLK